MRPSIMARLAALAVTASVACSESAAPILDQVGPVVPAGVTDPSWASIGKTCTPDSPASSLSLARVESLPPRPSYRHPDNEYEDAARTVPGGFGGLIVKEGVLSFFLVDTTQKAAAATALEPLFGVNPSAAHALPARWDFAQMHDWYRYLEIRLFGVRGRSSSDVDEGRNRIHFGVVDASARAALEAAVTALDVPCYLIAIDIEPPIRALSKGTARNR